ncbi:MAG: triosephosphate isomerase [Clostridia bacterium]|nr:triosephosphate isomerase [Clostridia bacterium]
MNKFLLGTNWKMHKTEQEALAYTEVLKEAAKEYEEYQFFIIPPYTDLKGVKQLLKDSTIILGAQNMHWESEGPYTGEISPEMLKEIGINLIELGHSERRQYYNENDFDLNKKIKAAVRYGFIPLLCVGEYTEDKEYGVTQEVLSKQIKIALHGVSATDASKVWIAYEPVWAIGVNGIPADVNYVRQVHESIREVLVSLYGNETAHAMPILYGGSVNPGNALELSKQPHVDGLFVGRSAWDMITFKQIMELLNK